MVAHGLVFDALVLPRHLSRLKTLIARHPDLAVVVDHGAKPLIRERTAWSRGPSDWPQSRRRRM